MKECQLCKNCFTDDVNTCPNDGMPTYHSIAGEPVLEGKYHLECRLGQGGMGVVYKARHAYLKTLHAIKVILPDLVGNDPQLVTRFRQEALAAAAIRHQNVVGVSDYGVAQGTMPFLVMEYVEGESLHDLLEREGKLSPEKALELMSAIAAGIGVAHKQGIVHRDLKPLNVMLLKDNPKMSEAVKILDFGLAKIKSGELLGSFIQAQTTGLMGSPFYMAPEQWADEEPDVTSDIYSLGIMFFQMLAGDVPFKGSSIPAIMKKHISDLPPTFASLGIEISPHIEKAVRHALEKDRRNRTPSVEEFIRELGEAIRSGSNSDAFNVSVSTSDAHLRTTSLQVLTIPALSSVFLNDNLIGKSGADGWIVLDKLNLGKHHIRVRNEGFFDFETEFMLDDSPKEIVAQLKKDTLAIPKPPNQTIGNLHQSNPNATQMDFSATQGNQSGYQHTAQNQQTLLHNTGQQTQQQNWQTGNQSVYTDSMMQAPPKSGFSPLILGVIGIFSVFALTLIGAGGAYMAGWIGPGGGTPSPSPTSEVTPTPPPTEIKAELIEIPGGSFKMGNNKGRENERPEHEATVDTFLMDKTEVTNGEYARFITETGYIPPAHFVNKKPVPGQESFPVSFVSYKDAEAFAQWRSKNESKECRLPTEEEWEFAARNGSKNNLFPWGDKWEEDMAVVERPNGNVLPVGSRKGANQWGVQDLIGNVWEWTNTKAKLYPGSPGVLNIKGNYYMVRGGAAISPSKGETAVNSTYREVLEESDVSKGVGFRLVCRK